MRTIPTFAEGDRVTYAARFLKSIGGGLETGLEDRIGTVRAVLPGGSATRIRVEWDDEPGELSSALPQNLARAGSFRAYDASLS